MGLFVRAGRNHFFELAGSKGVVVGLHFLDHVLFGEVHLFAEFFNRIGLAVGAVEAIELGNDLVEHGAFAVDDHPGLVVERLKRRRAGLDNIGVVFVHEALAGGVHLNAIAGIEHVGRIHMRDADDRTAVELVHVDEFGIERQRERNVFAGR